MLSRIRDERDGGDAQNDGSHEPAALADEIPLPGIRPSAFSIVPVQSEQ